MDIILYILPRNEKSVFYPKTGSPRSSSDHSVTIPWPFWYIKKYVPNMCILTWRDATLQWTCSLPLLSTLPLPWMLQWTLQISHYKIKLRNYILSWAKNLLIFNEKFHFRILKKIEAINFEISLRLKIHTSLITSFNWE